MSLTSKILFLTLSFFFLFPDLTHAQDSFNKTKFNVIHTILPDDSIETRLNIKITDARKGLEVTQFEIMLSPNIEFDDISATSVFSPVSINKDTSNTGTKLTFKFAVPVSSDREGNLMEVVFKQDKKIVRKGTAFELIVPTFATSDQPSDVTVNTSGFIDKKLTIAKPRPDTNEKTIFTWLKVSSPVIYLVFGEYQTYKVNLKYHLTNDRFVSVKQDVAFPPETALQQIFINKISPEPDEVILDSDGNYLGRYILEAQEKKNISFDGFVKVYATEQESMIPYIRNQIQYQKSYLLSEKKYWEIDDPKLISKVESLKSSLEIYDFVINTLNYSFQRLIGTNQRYGADRAFSSADKAVCMEYTDLFVAASRLNGIYSREIQGFGYSDDDRMRPLSLSSDVLHAWPEYYDTARELWVPLDPTWEDTSSIDYKHGLDLNHIVLSIHGKDSIYPLPAGMYKKGRTKDVDIRITTLEPKMSEDILVLDEIDKNIFRGDVKRGLLKIKNTGNTFIKDTPVSIHSDLLSVNYETKKIFLLSPGQSIQIPITYQAKDKIAKKAQIDVSIGGLYQNSYFIKIDTKLNVQFISMAKIAIIAIMLVFLVSLFLKRI